MKKEMDLFKSLKLLIVENDIKTKNEINSFLKKDIKNIYLASNVQEGLKIYKEHLPNLVICSIELPNEDGFSLVKKIKSLDENTKFILTSEHNDSKLFLNAIKAQIDDYIFKPINYEILKESIVNIAKKIYSLKKSSQLINTLSQYKDIVDERSIVSKTDLNGVITYVNKPFEEISGYKEDELIGKLHNVIRHEDTPNRVFKGLWKTILSKKTWHGIIKNKKKDGSYYIVDTIVKPILDINGDIEEFIALRNDITDLEESKEYFKNQSEKNTLDLKESIKKATIYKRAIDRCNIILRISKDRKITFANNAFCKISGYSKKELMGKSYDFIRDQNIDIKEYEKETNKIFKRLDNGHIVEGKISNSAKDGSVYYCKYTIFPIEDDDGKIVEYMSIRHDITQITKLHSELEETQREVIYKLGEIGETRSEETGNHVKRVAKYSQILARKIGMPEDEIKILFAASPMHDIGKVGIPDSILNKPGKLDSHEWEFMKSHCQIGYDILKSSNRPILKAAAIISYTHHEKWNGEGYPRGLKGEDIHIYGRITAVADVFDALGSDRCYKKAWEMEDIIKFLKDQKGEHFDPVLIDKFMENIDEFIQVREKYKDQF